MFKDQISAFKALMLFKRIYKKGYAYITNQNKLGSWELIVDHYYE